MKKRRKIKRKINGTILSNLSGELKITDEELEWLLNFTPAQRFSETTKLWQLYLSLGGRLDSQPDPQSPFYFQET